MAKKKLAQKIKARRKRRATSPERATTTPRRNPAGLGEFAEFAVPGFGGFVASKFVTRLAAQQLAKRWPAKAKHGSALVAVLSLASLWWFGNKWKWLAKYQMPVVIGSAIATAQSLMQLYFPSKLGWLVGDPGGAIALETFTKQQITAANQAAPSLPDHLEEISEDPKWYTYNDAYDAGRLQPTRQIPNDPVTINQPTTDLQDGDEQLAQGIFGGGGITTAGN